MATINWGRLVSQDRVKAFGVPWNVEEHQAVLAGVPADYVRKGCLTVEDYEKELGVETKHIAETGTKPLTSFKKPELLEMCEKLGLNVTVAALKETIVAELKSAGVPDEVAVDGSLELSASDEVEDEAEETLE